MGKSGRWNRSREEDVTVEATAAAGPAQLLSEKQALFPSRLAEESRARSEELVRELLSAPARSASAAAAEPSPSAAHTGAAVTAAAPEGAEVLDAAAGSEVTPEISGEDPAFFPVMSAAEVAAITVDASAPGHVLRETLEREGVALVCGVLSQGQCSAMEELWLRDLLQVLDSSDRAPETARAAAGLERDGVQAWRSEWSWLLGRKGAAAQRGMPQGAFAWAARLNARVRAAFAEVFECDPAGLAVGLDCPFWSAADAPAATENGQWLHVDQNHRTGLTWRCMQGVLYVWPSTGDGCSTTVVWPRSHGAVYEEMMADREAANRGQSIAGQSVRLNNLNDKGRRQRFLGAALRQSRRVPCPAGSLLLWDSRTVHQGWAGGPRLAQPVCWEPRERRDDDALRRKLWLCAAGAPSSHSSSEGRLHPMARSLAYCTMEEAETSRGLAALERMVPFPVAPGQERAWQELQEALFPEGTDAGKCMKKFTGSICQEVRRLLRPEVLAAL